MFVLAPSLLAADFNHLKRELNILEEEGVSVVHLDMMDGRFVPNLSFGMALIRGIRQSSNAFFDVHMMVEEPGHLLEAVKAAGADRITVHYEACRDIDSTVDQIRILGLEAGVAIKPETPVDIFDDKLLKKVSVVHLMTVAPGIPGQTFIETSIDRISLLKSRLNCLGSTARIEVDGDINRHNLEQVLLAGAEVIVIGTSLFGSNIRENIRAVYDTFAKVGR
ncbi:MAG: ribulose-phosphate 3-epimerase [Lachnospiraceae bacterium]